MSSYTQSLFRQLLGAATGSVVAVLLYGAYTMLSGPVLAMVAQVMPQAEESTSAFTDEDREARLEEVIARAKESIEQKLAAQ